MSHHVRLSSSCDIYLMSHIEFSDTVPETESVSGHEAADVIEVNVVTIRADDLFGFNICATSTSLGVQDGNAKSSDKRGVP